MHDGPSVGNLEATQKSAEREQGYWVSCSKDVRLCYTDVGSPYKGINISEPFPKSERQQDLFTAFRLIKTRKENLLEFSTGSLVEEKTLRCNTEQWKKSLDWKKVNYSCSLLDHQAAYE